MAKEKAAKHMPVKIRRNWPISTGLIASSSAFKNLPEKEIQIRDIQLFVELVMAIAFLIRIENENPSQFCPTWPIF
jgi:hypothetical protein